jgi:UDP-arabinose 4-epimerase
LDVDSKTVIVTGGAGYIGSHACKLLAQRGFNPVVIDNLSTGHRWAVQWGVLEECDIRDGKKLDEIFERHKPIAVMHFAAKISVGESVEEPDSYYNNNVGGTMALLDALKRNDMRLLVFSSTAAIFGLPKSVPIVETQELVPINPYGMSKYIAECMMADYAHAFGLRFVALRYFNATGSDPDADIGEAHDPETHLIPLVLDAAAGRREKIVIFGTDYETPDGTCIRDYIHVSDLVQAHILALNYLIDGGETQYFNLGNNQGYSVREIIEAAQVVTGKPIKTEEVARRAGDPAQLISNSELAKKVLGWQPARPDISVQIEDSWRWHMKYFEHS